MQWNGTPPPAGTHNPLRAVLEVVQQRAAPYVQRYGDNWIDGSGDLLNSIVRSGTEMTPGVGDLVALEDLQTAAQSNDWGGIGLGLLGAIPGIPAIGKGVRRGARRSRAATAEAVSDYARQFDSPEYRVQSSQDLAPTDTPESLRAQGYEIDPATNTWARTVAQEPTPESYPIRAYHGSPHSFDQFSLDAIGTGEGAQMFGRGLYVAENEAVARQYADEVKNMGPVRDINARLSELAAEMRPLEISYGKYREPRGYELKAEYDRLMDERAAGLKAPGNMYEVGINADPGAFIDYDAPLSQQPENVRRLLAPDGGEDVANVFPLYQGREQELYEQGVPGVRYRDQFSRDDRTDPTNNYVVFNDALLKVLRKYGISALGLGVGAGAVGAGQDAGI